MSEPDDARPRWQEVQVIVCAAVVGWALAYTLCDWGGWPRLTYDQYVGDWWLADGPTQRVPINYMGMLLWGLGGGATGALLALVGLRAWRRPLPSSVLALAGAWAITGVVLAGGYFTWMLWPF